MSDDLPCVQNNPFYVKRTERLELEALARKASMQIVLEPSPSMNQRNRNLEPILV